MDFKNGKQVCCGSCHHLSLNTNINTTYFSHFYSKKMAKKQHYFSELLAHRVNMGDIKVLSTISGLQSFGLKIMACIRHKLRTYFILTEFFSHQDFHYDLVTTTTRVLK